jgi:hypothetical protein
MKGLRGTVIVLVPVTLVTSAGLLIMEGQPVIRAPVLAVIALGAIGVGWFIGSSFARLVLGRRGRSR